MYKNSFISAIITAAGSGTRMGKDIPKLEIKLLEKPIIDYTIENISKLKIFDEIILVTSENLMDEYSKRFANIKNLKVVLGGESREASTFNGLKSLNKKSEIVLCHDGARPFVTEEIIINSIESAIKWGSGVAGVKVKDTIKIVENGIATSTPPRENLYQIQTPQTFKKELILKAYNQFYEKISATDDAEFLEAMGANVHIIKGSYKNIKITTPEDLIIGKSIMEVV